MASRHISSESVKAYLLGNIGEPDGGVIEREYFTDPSFFQFVRDVESRLIRDYLNEELTGVERERFVGRYLQVPELLARIEEVRAQGPPARRPVGVRWMWIAAGIALVCVGISPLLVNRVRAPKTLATAKPEPAVILAIRLSPGMVKGSADQVQFAAPERGLVRLSFELPGRKAAMDCVVTLSTVDGGNVGNWTVRTQASATGQDAVVDVDRFLLPRADYVAHVSGPGGEVLESYSFRVSARQP